MTSATVDRRGEAHLWLVLEEAVVAARAAEDDTRVWDVRRRFQSVADVLIAVGAVPQSRAQGIVNELDDALAVRGIVDPQRFASAFTLGQAAAAPSYTTGRARQPGDGWLEAEIEHHLDLVVDLRPKDHPDVADQVLANLGPQVRALRAVGSISNGRRLDDLVVTFEAAGYAIESDAVGRRGEVDRGWLSFLRARPRPLRTDDDVAHERTPAAVLGEIDRQPVRVTRIAWSADVLEFDVAAPTIAGVWHASAFDDRGQLHLGQPGQVRGTPPSPLAFRLRPGLRDGARSLSVRVTFGATRLDERVTL